MRVLVIGGTRFVGRAITEHLLREGHDVTLLNRGLTADPFATQVRRIVGDRRDPETIKRAAHRRDFDAVVDVTAYHESETQVVVDEFRDRIGHFVHVSTASVYLVRDGIFPPYIEDEFAGPVRSHPKGTESAWLYALHKRQCEQVLVDAWTHHQFPYTSIRLPMVVGPNDYTRRADAYLERIVLGGAIILPGGGLNTWGFLWVDDVGATVASNILNANAFGRAYNLAQREAVSLRQFVKRASRLLDRQSSVLGLPPAWLEATGLGCGFSPFTHDHDILLDCHAAREELVFRPTPFAQWVELLVQDFLSRFDGVPRAFASTRDLELALAREISKIRLPSFAKPG
ncbi:MAG: NAD-dependent epimerase/dehydratase family protein, partial [bacterium]|nr:NAD-dependent epimerase/dehydratase family protein [bacterium]